MMYNKFLALFSGMALLFLGVSCSDGNTYAVIETDFGNMKVLLYDTAPLHKENFVKLAKEGYYDDLLFHRVVKGFVIQGGDPDSRNAPKGQQLGFGGPNYKIDPEIGSPHLKGALAMAQDGNPQKQSSGSQFYIVHGSPVAAQDLQRIQQARGFSYNPAQLKLYQEIGGTPALDGQYTVFGEVVEGMEVIDKIADQSVDQASRPLEDVRMKVRLVR